MYTEELRIEEKLNTVNTLSEINAEYLDCNAKAYAKQVPHVWPILSCCKNLSQQPDSVMTILLHAFNDLTCPVDFQISRSIIAKQDM